MRVTVWERGPLAVFSTGFGKLCIHFWLRQAKAFYHVTSDSPGHLSSMAIYWSLDHTLFKCAGLNLNKPTYLHEPCFKAFPFRICCYECINLTFHPVVESGLNVSFMLLVLYAFILLPSLCTCV